MGPNSKLGESSRVKIEIVPPSPAIEILTTKRMMEPNSPSEEKIELQTQLPVAFTRLERMGSDSDIKSRLWSNGGNANCYIYKKI